MRPPTKRRDNTVLRNLILLEFIFSEQNGCHFLLNRLTMLCFAGLGRVFQLSLHLRETVFLNLQRVWFLCQVLFKL